MAAPDSSGGDDTANGGDDTAHVRSYISASPAARVASAAQAGHT